MLSSRNSVMSLIFSAERASGEDKTVPSVRLIFLSRVCLWIGSYLSRFRCVTLCCTLSKDNFGSHESSCRRREIFANTSQCCYKDNASDDSMMDVDEDEEKSRMMTRKRRRRKRKVESQPRE